MTKMTTKKATKWILQDVRFDDLRPAERDLVDREYPAVVWPERIGRRFSIRAENDEGVLRGAGRVAMSLG